MSTIQLNVEPTIGGSFTIECQKTDSIQQLKSKIGKRFKLNNLVLLFRERKLEHGTIESNLLEDGSTIRLLLAVEAGLVTHRPDESTVLEALNRLGEGQVAEFLSGQSPLNLTMRLGEHVMLIQLKLSKGEGSAEEGAAQEPRCSGQATDDETRSSDQSNEGEVKPGGSAKLSANQSTEPAEEKANLFESDDDASDSDSESSAETKPPSLTEASRHLTHTLRKLSENVHTEPTMLQRHGEGVYSGVFAGTLNKCLQDKEGRPHEHVSTIVHILNDLLATMDSSSTATPLTTFTAQPPKRRKVEPPPAKKACTEQENATTRRKMELLRKQLKKAKEARS